MDEKQKQQYYQQQQLHVDFLIQSINKSKKEAKKKEQHAQITLTEAIVKGNANDQLVQKKLKNHYAQKQKELNSLAHAPFFTTLKLEGKDLIHIGKFSYTDKNIYSWVSPIAALRFELPGQVHYQGQNQNKIPVILNQKDQVMIQKGKITFLSTETRQYGRTLVYQTYFSNRKKTGFVLPDIVEKMEKSQDQVIRASVKGPLIISGPAGSGKTTLALHRVAYLLQSPNLAKHFRAREVIVFVQDIGTKKYFSALLPELGIHEVTITTFAEWAMEILDLKASYSTCIGNSEKERNEYTFAKIQALQQVKSSTRTIPFLQLEETYKEYFNKSQKKLFQMQKASSTVDRIDLTILLKLFYRSQGTFTANKEYYQMKKNYSAIKKIGRFPLKYTLMIFDEFQNYLPEQISLAQTTLDEHFQAAMYIGDMNQQTWLGTIRQWSDIDTTVRKERQITLQQVYRNTKSILRYIKSCGYAIYVDERVPEGEDVQRIISKNIVADIKHHLPKDNSEIGIIGMTPESIQKLKKEFISNKHIHVLTARESQGVEFDTVFFIKENTQPVFYSNKNLQKEVHQVEKDLQYVALTRAINKLIIIEKEKSTTTPQLQ